MANTARLAAMACLMLAAGATRADSQPDFGSADSLMPACEAVAAQRLPGANDFLGGVCSGQVEAIWDVASALDKVCSPPGVTLVQAVRVVVQFINARPVRMHEHFALLALEAMIAAWPCGVT